MNNIPESPRPKHATVYHMELCHGGHEEGGWWYTRLTQVFSLPVADDVDPAVVEHCAKGIARDQHGLLFDGDTINTGYGDRKVRSYRSAAPEENAIVMLEQDVGEHETRSRPRYE